MGSLTDVKYIRALCEKYDFRLKKGLGQNFLHDDNVLSAIAEAALPDGGNVLEVGPGFGVLTRALAEKADKVCAVEIDKALLPVLSETLDGYDNIKIISGDILKLDIAALCRDTFGDGKIAVAANLPYYITTPILFAFLKKDLPISRIVVMMQKEVAARLLSPPGKKDYGALTVAVQYRCLVSRVLRVPAASFFPPPKVDSEVLLLEMRHTPPKIPKNEDFFFSLVRAAFSQRRKTLANALASAGTFGSKAEIEEAISSLSLPPAVRGETLSIESFVTLSDILFH